MGRLTTHVLDTANGRPAAGMAFTLSRLDGRLDGRQRITLLSGVTNADGRCDHALLADADFVPGVYELEFAAGDYFRACGSELPEPPFLDQISLRFGIADASSHYHVPLLVSPWAYSTYRGS